MMLTRDPEFAKRDWSFVKSVTFGGAPLAPHLVDEITRKLGVDVFTGYSCTETAIISATLPSDPPERRAGTVGRPDSRRRRFPLQRALAAPVVMDQARV